LAVLHDLEGDVFLAAPTVALHAADLDRFARAGLDADVALHRVDADPASSRDLAAPGEVGIGAGTLLRPAL
jgi:hypothetical protein